MQKLMSLVIWVHGALGQGRRQGGAFLICSTVVDPYSVDLDLSCSVTQIDSCFDLHTGAYNTHKHVHPYACSQDMLKQTWQEDVQPQSYPFLGLMLGQGDQFHPSALTVHLLLGTLLSFPISSTSRGPLNLLFNIKPQKGSLGACLLPEPRIILRRMTFSMQNNKRKQRALICYHPVTKNNESQLQVNVVSLLIARSWSH